MKFVECNITKKSSIYINRDKVISITPSGESKSIIKMQDQSVTMVLHSAKEVVALLTKEDIMN